MASKKRSSKKKSKRRSRTYPPYSPDNPGDDWVELEQWRDHRIYVNKTTQYFKAWIGGSFTNPSVVSTTIRKKILAAMQEKAVQVEIPAGTPVIFRRNWGGSWEAGVVKGLQSGGFGGVAGRYLIKPNKRGGKREFLVRHLEGVYLGTPVQARNLERLRKLTHTADERHKKAKKKLASFNVRDVELPKIRRAALRINRKTRNGK